LNIESHSPLQPFSVHSSQLQPSSVITFLFLFPNKQAGPHQAKDNKVHPDEGEGADNEERENKTLSNFQSISRFNELSNFL